MSAVTASATVSSTARRTHRAGIVCGLGSALTFGASAPLAKLLLPHIGPLTLAALLNAGATIGLHLTEVLAGIARGGRARAGGDTPLQRADWPVLLATILAGGVVGPMLLMLGLQHVSGVTGSLLLNLESPFTIGIAVLVFREHLGPRALGGAACILAGAVALGAVSGMHAGSSAAAAHSSAVGMLLVAAACVAWAIDSNLSQKLSLRDPWHVVRIKTLGAAMLSAIIVWLAREPAPHWSFVPWALALGYVSYGLSIILYIHALRAVGAARQGALFAAAPFAGALLAVPVLGDRIGAFEVLAGVAMAAGVALLASDMHVHEHAHEAVEHEHLHVHDAHHRHAHDALRPAAPADAGDRDPPPGESHAHPHVHAPLVHSHPHVSDVHHRHEH